MVVQSDAELRFVPETHEYFLGDRKLISVTKVCEEAGLIKGLEWMTEESRLIGGFAHKAMLFFMRGTLDEESLDDAYRGYVESGKKFLAQTGFKPVRIEVPDYNPLYGYAGTPDLVGTIGSEHWLLDFKTGAKMAWHALQTAAYDLIVPRSDELGIVRNRGSVYLREDGKLPHFEKHTNKSDAQVFLSALALCTWKRNHGI